MSQHLWLPYTQMQHAAPLEAATASGVHITLANGKKLLDCTASWWTACHGYSHPHIIKAMDDQLQKMSHIMLGGLVHEPALSLAKKLAEITPAHLQHVFFSESGSVSVEIAMKMALQFWQNKKQNKKTRFVSFQNAYHGDSFATMSLCDEAEGMHRHFPNGFPPQIQVKLCPQALEEVLQKQANQIAAIIIEPLIQGAGGMVFHDKKTLSEIARLAKHYEVLLIADEIMTGFGRTGTLFACEQAGIAPDIMTLSKALTGGMVPLAATIASQQIFDSFLSTSEQTALMHGPTFSGNPLACRAALASLSLFEQEPRLAQIATIETAFKKGLDPLNGKSGIKETRSKGAVGVIELEQITPSELRFLRTRFAQAGLWCRPFGNIIYATPAFIIKEAELALICKTMCEISEELLKKRG